MKNSINDMALFIKIIENGSLTRTAIALDMSLSAVSRHLKELEQRLDVCLIIRHAQQFKMTDEGTIYYQNAKAIMKSIDELEEEVRGKGVLRGNLKISTTHGFGKKHMAPLLAKFSKMHPELRISLSLLNNLSFMGDSIDIALMVNPPKNDNYVMDVVLKDNYVIVASPDYLQRTPEINTPSDLLKHHCLCLNNDRIIMNKWSFYLDGYENNVQVQPYLLTDSGETLRDWALAGEGVAYKLSWDLVDDINTGRLIQCLPHLKTEQLELCIVYRKQRNQPARIREMIKFLKANILNSLS
ncbi:MULTISPECIES: LysR family transcriptional regulator [Acinetobacter]|uniref:LysR family transcriptional regulator n=1 Tax=Acinetobacter TaxID=469 RepID=UPI0018FF6449|nr:MULTISPECIES: LysR family transcriptional regulator [Acinetobacter]MBJ8453065.1 LysR family transcriptional regulator [Acinetobacter bereziniae]MBJ8458532.1 LysR family transcriptional regulator [Acinetobacter bereziniae]MCU4316402.1 LysR family transcriptional regulator [Acinetobacter bereziniae]UJA00544.1 LysR family transcriptional regulator [Acinetobacter johnsonii]